MALIAFVPQLWSQPGVADSDTKSYLYLDPGRYLGQSASMWNPNIGLGTVTHEQIGFLWPLDPFFWAVHALGIPLWVGQRLWVGLLLFGAGAGVLYLCRTVGLGGPGRFVAAVAYMLSPYFLQDVGRIGTLVLPWAGLGWMVAFVIRGVRTGGWRYPALSALVWLTVSGNNASGPVYAAVAPLLWLVYAVFVAKDHTLRQAWGVIWRTAILVAGVSLWWAWALAIESGYGLNVLGTTETVSAVAKTSLSSEVLRGLGYWFYYGADLAGPWAATSAGFTQDLWLIGLSFAVPLVALVAAVVVRWRQRFFFLVLIIVGMILAVGSHPYGDPSILGGVIKSFMTKTTAGLALRSSDRATPIVLLGLAVLLGAGVTALAHRRRLLGAAATVLTLATVAAANPPAWNGTTVLDRYTFPTPIPSYVTQAADALNATHRQTRVLAVPGDNFGAYRYGNTVDPIWPGLLTRPFATHEQVVSGSLPSYDLLYALDYPMQNRTAVPADLAPLARLMSVGDVLVQSDIAYELYNRPPPQQFWKSLDLPAAGLGDPVGYGTPTPNVSMYPMVDETTLASSPDARWPSPLEVLSVADPRPLVRGESTTGALVVAGDGVGLKDIAGLGLLDTTSPVLFSRTLDQHPTAMSSALAGGATLVVTDSNRRQTFLWNAVSGSAGVTLAASDPRPKVALDIFGHSPADAQTTSQVSGVASVQGVPTDPDHSPVMAIDGMRDTAWETHYGTPAVNKYWQVTLTQPTTTGHATILQRAPGDYQVDQWITRATLSFDGGSPVDVELGTSSRSGAGQVVTFPRRTFSTLRITIDATTLSSKAKRALAPASPVGLAEVGLAGARAQNVIAMPDDLLHSVGTASQSHRLVVVMTRQRVAPIPPAADPEPVLARTFTLPAARTFALTGTARVSASAADDTVDAVVGRPPADKGGIVAYSSGRLPGDVRATASAALDGDPTTMWSPGMGAGNQQDAWIQVNRPQSSTVDHLNLVVAADGHHSVPTALRVQACDRLATDGRCPAGSHTAAVTLPAVADGRRRGATVGMPVHFAPVTGHDLTVTVTGLRTVTTKDYTSQAAISLPLGIAELGVPGTSVAAPGATLPATCRTDLLSVDGRPVPLAVTGSTATALGGGGLTVRPCGADAGGITLGPGSHVVVGTPGATTGFDIDQLVLDSAPGGGPAASGGTTGAATTAATTATAVRLAAPVPGPAPSVHVTSSSATTLHLRVTGATRPFWLVLGESINTGWTATVGATGHDLGPSTLIDGYANGWLVRPTGTGAFSVTLRWTPQSIENIMLVVSGLAVAACLALVLWPRRRRAPSGGPGDVAVASAAGRPPAHDAAGTPAMEDVPTMANPFAEGREITPALAAVVAAATGFVAAVLVPPPAFLAIFAGVALAMLAALVIPRARGLLALAVVGFAVGGAAYTVAKQASQHFPPGGWPVHFEAANVLVWTAIVFLGADAVVELLRRRRR